MSPASPGSAGRLKMIGDNTADKEKMRYYVTADIHGFYSVFHQGLADAGFFGDPEPHKLIILGDLFDRGNEAEKLQDFILRLMEEDSVILIRGNHEDLFEDLATVDNGVPYEHHVHNGTYETALSLTGYNPLMARLCASNFAKTARETPLFQKIIPAALDYYETERYIFVHGWIPCLPERWTAYGYWPCWREAGEFEWRKARWYNGMDAAQNCKEEKTILCGHCRASYGHAKYENKGSDFGPDADYSPYYGPGVIALDACTAYSGKINIIVIED